MTQADDQMIARHVRSAVIWPAIAAALLLWYALPLDAWSLPTSQPAKIGGQICLYTMFVGGVLMAVAAVWLLTGNRHGLLFDGVVAMLIGGLFVAGGAAQMSSGGMQPMLYIIFGVMFVVSGRRNWLDYRLLVSGASPVTAGPYDPRFDQRYEQARQDAPEGSLPGQLRDRVRQRADDPESAQPVEPPVVEQPAAPDPPAPPAQPPPVAPTSAAAPTPPEPEPSGSDEPAPDGFLAQFAEPKDRADGQS